MVCWACAEELKPRTIPSARMPNLILFVWIISPSRLQNSTRNLSALRETKPKKQLRGARQKVHFVRWRIPSWRFRSEEHTSELQSQSNLVCRLLLEKKKKTNKKQSSYRTSCAKID